MLYFIILYALPAFLSRGSTNRVASWYQIMTEETKGYIHATGFDPITHLLLETSTIAILVQCLSERW